MSRADSSGSSGTRLGDRPPRLSFNLLRQLMMLVLMNGIPIGMLVWLGRQHQLGLLGFQPGSQHIIGLAVLLLAAAMVVLALTWIVLPSLRWARRWSAWHIDHPEGITLLGLVVMPCAYLVSAINWILCLLIAVMLGFSMYHQFLAAQPALEDRIEQVIP